MDWQLPCNAKKNRPVSVQDFALLTIPAETTGQKTTVRYIRFPFMEEFYKIFFGYCVLLDLEVKLYSRDSILKLQSLIHFQFFSPRFRNLFRYVWHKCDYIDIKQRNLKLL